MRIEVDLYQFIRHKFAVEGLSQRRIGRDSVPVELAGCTVTVKGYGHTVGIYHRENEVAVYERLYGKGRTSYQLAHYLRLLEMKPRSVFHAKPVREANLPGAFEEFARASDAPGRIMVRLLRLCVECGVGEVAEAVSRTLATGSRWVEVVRHYLAKAQGVPVLPSRGPSVQPPDLSRYDLLLGGGRT